MLGNRPLGFVARNAMRRENWQALARMPLVYPDFPRVAYRYFSGRGEYPDDCAIRTPLGTVRPRLWSSQDLITVNEIFCRCDYAASPDARVIVDVGSNIGISALYFLTRHRDVRCYLYEPVARNVERLRENLEPFDGRWSVEEVAVWDRAGTVEFGIEATGRYGGIGLETPERIRVSCIAVNDALEGVLEREGHIDVLKVDTEGAEVATVAAIRPDLLEHVDTIYFETGEREVLHPSLYASSFACDTCRLSRRR